MPYINKGWIYQAKKSTYNESLEDNNHMKVNYMK
jgi:hypothetical protein